MILLPPEDAEELTRPHHQALHDDLRRGWHAKTVCALATQARIAGVFGDLRPVHNEALGQLTLVVDPHIYYEMRRLEGPECWRDPAFRRRFAQDNPAANIRSKSRKIAVPVNGLRAGVCTP
jgi:hypothetical protein